MQGFGPCSCLVFKVFLSFWLVQGNVHPLLGFSLYLGPILRKDELYAVLGLASCVDLRSKWASIYLVHVYKYRIYIGYL